MLQLRKRGTKGIYQVRGTVQYGDKSVYINGQSTGTSSKSEASEYAHELEKKIKKRLQHGNKRLAEDITLDECLELYLTNKRLKTGELNKIDVLRKDFKDIYISELKDAWRSFTIKKRHLAPATLNRYLECIMAVVRFAALEYDFQPPKIQRMKVNNVIVFHLNNETREKLLSCYSKHTKPIFTVYSLQGLREQEGLQINWEDVNFLTKTILIPYSKNGESRNIPMHNKTFWMLARMWIKKGKPSSGKVFLNRLGEAYQDTRLVGGGTPLRKAHLCALAKLEKDYGIKLKMRIHDWRHDWASRCVMAGMDLLTLAKIGGWKSLRMVQRYATFSKDHELEAINKI